MGGKGRTARKVHNTTICETIVYNSSIQAFLFA
jgi:hypothetical protein